jgi:hypothetical protein
VAVNDLLVQLEVTGHLVNGHDFRVDPGLWLISRRFPAGFIFLGHYDNLLFFTR